MCRRWLALGREDALWQPLAALRPEFAAALARRLSATSSPRPRALAPAAPPAAAAPPWHSWYGARARGAVRWRSAAPSSAAVLGGVEGHLGTIFGVTPHPSDPSCVFSAGEDARLRLWDAPAGRFLGGWDIPALQGLFNVHAFDTAAAHGSDGGDGGAQLGCWVAACGFNGDVALLPLRAPPQRGRSASAEERLEALALGGEIADAADAAFSDDEEDADADAEGAGARAARRRVASPAGAGVLLAGHAAPVVSARSRGATLATCSFDGTVRIWCVAAAAAAAEEAAAAAAEARADGRAVPSSDTPHVPSRRAAAPPPVFATPRAVLNDVPMDAALGPHEYSVAAVCMPPGAPGRAVRGGNDALVKTWDIERGVVTAAFAGHTGWIWCLEPADVAGNLVMTGATDSTLRGWDLRAPDGGNALRPEPLRNAGPISGLAVRPTESRVVAGAFDGLVRLFDLRMMVSGDDGGDGGSRAMGPPLRGHADRVSRVAATDAFAVSASFDGTLRAWQFDAV